MNIDTSRSLLGRIAKGGGQDGWKLFVSIYGPFILKCLRDRNIPQSDADDLSQEALATVYRSIGRFEHNGRVGAFRHWIKVIVSQTVWTYFQNIERINQVAQAARQVAENVARDSQSDLELQWDREHDRHIIEQMLNLIRREFTLSSWRAFHLVVIDGLTPRQAADQLSVSVNAVLIAKSRIMRRLRQFGAGMITGTSISKWSESGQ